MRFGRVLAIMPLVLSIGLGLAALVLATHKVYPEHLAASRTRLVLYGIAGVSALALLVAALRRLPPRAGAMALDRVHALTGRLTNALEFEALPAKDRTPLMQAAIDDAIAHAQKLSPRKAAPIRVPIEMLFVLLMAAGLYLVTLFEIRTLRPEPPKNTIDALVMTSDDLDLFRDAAKQLERGDQSPETKQALERFNRLIEDLAEHRLDRTEAFRQMEAIERDLLEGQKADQDKLKEELDETAKQLDKSDLAKNVADALKKNDLKQAQKEMKDLANKLRDKKAPPDKKALEKLKDALQKASEHRKEALAAINEKREAMQEQLLKKKKDVEAQKDPDKKKEEEKLLHKKERELERLDREAEKQQRANRELDRLDRELAKAAADLMKDMGVSADDLEKAAEDINRMQQEQMSEKDKEELKQRLEELREILRQQGQGGKKRMSRMKSFSKRARGGKSSKGGDEGEDEGDEQDGQKGKKGQGKDGQDGDDGDDGDGQGKGKGKGKGKGGGIELKLGPGGIPIPGQGDGQGDQPGGGEQPGGDGAGKGGKEWGNGSGGPIAGDKTNPKMGTQDVDERGLDSGQGPTNSEVILSAAEKGFRGTGYKKVFTQYRTVAEDNIDKEEVPDGYRFYVKRYFQLIRPRE
jgi:hypothetical protein